ncbi:hypothetical protein NKH77_26035 [Streptomyces sp. M19]
MSAATLLAVTAPALAVPMPPRGSTHDSDMGDRLTIKVSASGDAKDATTTRLRCHPRAVRTRPAGRLRPARRADPLGQGPVRARVPDALCTGQYGGSATAHVTGHWAGRPVDAHFSRTDGCQIDRWNRFSTVLHTDGS